jgi:predicted Zn finger-like uncharacterized protein
MIIICKECSSKFKLDESLLKGTGSQVRCNVCKNIFTAYPPNVLGQPEATPQAAPAPQGYFDSEEELGPGGVGGFQKPAPDDDDDDGLELDVDEEDEDMDGDGLDLGDDDSEFDDAGIEMGNNSGMDTGMNFDEDMDVDGIPDIDFGTESDAGDIDLDTGINSNLDQGEDIELDAKSDMKNDSNDSNDSAEPGVELPDLDPVPVTDDSSGTDEDFDFEFELDEEEGSDIEEDIKLNEPTAEIDIDEAQETSDTDIEEDFEMSIFDDDDLDKEQEVTTSMEVDDEILSPEKTEKPDDEIEFDSMELEIDDSEEEDVSEGDDFVEKFEDDDEYEIEEFDEADEDYEDDDIIDEEYEDGVDPENTLKPVKKGGRQKVLVAILMLLIVGYGSWALTDGFKKSIDFSKINFSAVKNLLNFSKMDEIPVWATIDNQSLNGRYVTNESSGKIFVITGKITNESKIPLNNIEVEGTLISKGGVVAKKKRVFCGNQVPEGQLSTLTTSAINKVLQRKNGEQGANLNIKTKGSVPFMVVFSNLPEELENYTVTVTSFKRMK